MSVLLHPSQQLRSAFGWSYPLYRLVVRVGSPARVLQLSCSCAQNLHFFGVSQHRFCCPGWMCSAFPRCTAIPARLVHGQCLRQHTDGHPCSPHGFKYLPDQTSRCACENMKSFPPINDLHRFQVHKFQLDPYTARCESRYRGSIHCTHCKLSLLAESRTHVG